MAMDKLKLKQIRADINAALQEIIEIHGFASCKIVGNINYTDTSFRCTIEAAMEEHSQEKEKMFNLIAEPLGLPPYGTIIQFPNKNTKYRIVDYKNNRPKYPVVLENIKNSSKRIKTTVSYIKQAKIIEKP
jgi:hypothetical protein